jgi:3',5'-cyclic AMP phosphodiesterase CpdA
MTRILHLSDPHFGAADERVAEAFLAAAWRGEPDLTVLSGDLTMRARRGELAAARRFVDRLPRPHLIIPGNHDIPAFNHPWDRLFRPFRRYRRTFGGELEPQWRGGGVNVVALNSSRALGLHADWSEGRLSRAALERAAGRFDTPTDELRVLVLHHPLQAPPDHRRAVVKPLEKLHALLERRRVDLVLCGHFHRSHVAAVAAGNSWHAVVSQAPTVCSTRLQGEPPGFHEICWEGERMTLRWLRFEGDGFAPVVSSSFHRGARGWSPAGA